MVGAGGTLSRSGDGGCGNPIFASSSVSTGMKLLCRGSLPDVLNIGKGIGWPSRSPVIENPTSESGGSSLIVLARLTSTSLPLPLEVGTLLASESGVLASLRGGLREMGGRPRPKDMSCCLSWFCPPSFLSTPSSSISELSVRFDLPKCCLLFCSAIASSTSLWCCLCSSSLSSGKSSAVLKNKGASCCGERTMREANGKRDCDVEGSWLCPPRAA